MVAKKSKENKENRSLEVQYGVFMEKLCTKLRRLSLIGAYQHKNHLGSLLKSTVDAQNKIKEDENLDETTKNTLLLRTDTLTWFMGSMLEEIQDSEKLQKNMENPEGENSQESDALSEDEINYLG